MSRIFEALHKSELDRAGTSLQSTAVATELLQEVEQARVSKDSRHPVQPEVVRVEIGHNHLSQFPSLPIALPQYSKLVCLTAQESFGAEKFRFLGVRLRQLQQANSLKTLLITSTIPEEGKSTVAANLAAILSRRQQPKILLLEGDLRRPSLASQFGLGNIPGLSEWLQEDPCPIKHIYRLEGPNLWFLPAGRPPANPLELMQSGKLSNLMSQLSTWFDWIIIDSPPILPLGDTSVWARLADGILLVTREGVTKKKLLERGLEALQESKLLGAVLNSSVNTDHSDYYQRYGPKALRTAESLEK